MKSLPEFIKEKEEAFDERFLMRSGMTQSGRLVANLAKSFLTQAIKDSYALGIEHARQVREIPLTQGKVALVDADDYEAISKYRWHARVKYGNCDYARSVKASKALGRTGQIYMHQFIMKADKDQFVDHINGDGLDNRKENLRFTTRAGNARNRGPIKSNTSGATGVRFTESGKWGAFIKVNRESIWLGTFDTKKEAINAYEVAAEKHHGAFRRNATQKELSSIRGNDLAQ